MSEDKNQAQRERIAAMIAEEYARANQIWPPFASYHEGWAVLKEEVGETGDEIGWMNVELDRLWSFIVNNREREEMMAHVRELRERAVRGIEELIQVAAVCDKIKDVGRAEKTDRATEYLTEHNRLLEDGWEIFSEDESHVKYELQTDTYRLHLLISKAGAWVEAKTAGWWIVFPAKKIGRAIELAQKILQEKGWA